MMRTTIPAPDAPVEVVTLRGYNEPTLAGEEKMAARLERHGVKPVKSRGVGVERMAKLLSVTEE